MIKPMKPPPPSPEAKTFTAWIRSLPADERRQAERLGVAKYDEPSTYGRAVEDWQIDRIEQPAADDDDDFNLRLDLLNSGAPAERLDDICEAIELHGEAIGFRHARRALHALTLPLMASTEPKLHALAHALGMTMMTLEESAEVCGCSRQAIHRHVVKFRERLTPPTL
jgi:hypothetical protein